MSDVFENVRIIVGGLSELKDKAYPRFLVHLAMNVLHGWLRHSIVVVQRVDPRVEVIQPFSSLVVALKRVAMNEAYLSPEKDTPTSLLVHLIITRIYNAWETTNLLLVCIEIIGLAGGSSLVLTTISLK